MRLCLFERVGCAVEDKCSTGGASGTLRPKSTHELFATRDCLANRSISIADAVGEVWEMFLKVDQVGVEAVYSLAPLTRYFVLSRKEAIQTYSVVRERVRAFKRNVYISYPKVADLVLRVQRIIPPRLAEQTSEDASAAWRVVSDPKLTPNVTEDPLFRALYGYVASSCSPPHLAEARSAFLYAGQMKYELEFRYLLAWFSAERNSGVLDRWCEKIADIVISGKRYTQIEKISMISRKAGSI